MQIFKCCVVEKKLLNNKYFFLLLHRYVCMSYDEATLDLEYQVYFQLLFILECKNALKHGAAEQVFVFNFQKLIDMHIIENKLHRVKYRS